MKTAGIVAEYNPFHNGHGHLIRVLREAGFTHIVAVMSGCFTQRGEAACMTKPTRCEAALRGGADLVIELPVPWASAAAESFARGSVGLLGALGCVDALAFGSECAEKSRLLTTARLLLETDGGEEFKDALRSGCSFPRAARRAAAERFPGTDLTALDRPNDTLAVEYCKALLRGGAEMEIFPVRREGAAHDEIAACGGYASASYLRGLLAGGHAEEIRPFVPESVFPVYARELAQGHAPFDGAAMELMILSRLRQMDERSIAALPDVCEGLENRVLEAAGTSVDLNGLYGKIKSKRYTLARIRRIAVSALLSLRREDGTGIPPYLRVLGLSDRGGEILRRAKTTASLPVVSRHSELVRLGERAQRVYAIECLASDLYGLCLPSRLPCGCEQKYRACHFSVENN